MKKMHLAKLMLLLQIIALGVNAEVIEPTLCHYGFIRNDSNPALEAQNNTKPGFGGDSAYFSDVSSKLDVHLASLICLPFLLVFKI